MHPLELGRTRTGCRGHTLADRRTPPYGQGCEGTGARRQRDRYGLPGSGSPPTLELPASLAARKSTRRRLNKLWRSGSCAIMRRDVTRYACRDAAAAAVALAMPLAAVAAAAAAADRQGDC
eukprot:256190-Chlamydomonas_euryale.AAC.3